VNRRSKLKVLAVTSAIFSFIPAVIYYVTNARSLHANKNMLNLREIYALLAVTLIALVSHAGVTFVTTSVGLGAGFFMVSVFIQATAIAALILFYKAARYTHYNPKQSGNQTFAN
jgi:hypothetical protein